jgi:hypothetical protein
MLGSPNGARHELGNRKEVKMMKLIWALRVVAFLMVVGTIGSIEIDRIDCYTAILQILLGFVLLILSNYWAREIRFYERKKSPLIMA